MIARESGICKTQEYIDFWVICGGAFSGGRLCEGRLFQSSLGLGALIRVSTVFSQLPGVGLLAYKRDMMCGAGWWVFKG